MSSSRNNFLIAGCLFLFFAIIPVFSQDLGTLIAEVTLNTRQVVPFDKFKAQIQLLEARSGKTTTFEERRSFLNAKIGEILVTQAAQASNIEITQEDITDSINDYRNHLGVQISDSQFLVYVQNQFGMNWEQFVEYIKLSILQEKYIIQAKGLSFSELKEPSAAKIQEFYNANAAGFIRPEMVRYSHIFFDTRNLSAEEKNMARERAEQVWMNVQNSPVAFSNAVSANSDDTASKYKGGDVGFLFRNDNTRKQLFGDDYFNSVFASLPNKVSKVLESNLGFHIVLVTEHADPKLLSLNDYVFPGSTETVRARISSVLQFTQKQEIFKVALQDVVADLKNQADIKLYLEKLNW